MARVYEQIIKTPPPFCQTGTLLHFFGPYFTLLIDVMTIETRLQGSLPTSKTVVAKCLKSIQGSLVGPLSVHFMVPKPIQGAPGELQNHIFTLFWNFE